MRLFVDGQLREGVLDVLVRVLTLLRRHLRFHVYGGHIFQPLFVLIGLLLSAGRYLRLELIRIDLLVFGRLNVHVGRYSLLAVGRLHVFLED